MGKSGYIARKISSSLSSTGTPSFFVHPGEASHGDLGMITKQDIVIMLSNSGETKELSDTITYCEKYNIPIIGMTMNSGSTLAKSCDYLLLIPEFKEASSVSAPTTSAMVMLALGDALAVCLHEAKGFSSDDFRKFHPGGTLGKRLGQ
jgi:arabinose-5-phosphate isomerase